MERHSGQATSGGKRSALAVLSVVCAGFLVAASLTVTAAAKTTVTFATWGTEADWKPWVDMFKADNPDIDVKVVATDWATYWQKIDVMLAGAMDVDVVRLGGQHLPTYARQGVLADMGPYFRRDIKAADFFPGALAGCEYRGVLYAVPEHFSPTTGYFNVSMYENAGLESPYDLWKSGRWTWDNFVAGAKRLTQDVNGDGRPDRWGAYLNWMDDGVWQSLVVSNGGTIYDPDFTRSTLDQPKALAALSWLTGLATRERVESPDADADWDAWVHGNVGFTHGAPSYMQGWKTFKFTYDMVPLPIPEGGKETAVNVLNLLAITKTSRHPEAAWRFVSYILSAKVQDARIQKWQILSARRDTAVKTVTGKYLPVAHPEVLVRIAETSFPMQATVGFIQISAAVSSGLNDVVQGKLPIDVAVKERIVPKVDQLLAQARS
ncbi:MAG: sugar ABC transporter substrate-binding protein [Limnochordaceae bacterium]|nr:sugar ABC transporter substrate-binding protein [Limnochordaceae bacterium]